MIVSPACWQFFRPVQHANDKKNTIADIEFQIKLSVGHEKKIRLDQSNHAWSSERIALIYFDQRATINTTTR